MFASKQNYHVGYQPGRQTIHVAVSSDAQGNPDDGAYATLEVGWENKLLADDRYFCLG